MDAELRQYLDTEFNRRFSALADLIQANTARIDQRFDSLDARFEALETRLDRQAALIQTGSRWVVRTGRWAEKIDKEIAQILKRLEKLEDERRAS